MELDISIVDRVIETEVVHMKKAYRGWFGRMAKRRCPHAALKGIYGDEITAVGGWRLLCGDCGSFLDGPVSLARDREPST